MHTIKDRVKQFIKQADELEVRQLANIKTKERLEASIQKIVEEAKLTAEELEIVTNAVNILHQISDEAIQKSYQFIADNINAALERIFTNTTRKIRLREYTRGQYPQLEVELIVEGGKTRTLRADSGHGIMQIISLLCILCIIVITKSRRTLWMDEILSGLSAKSRMIVSEILWSFAEIGFQFVISEHGFVPKGAKVYKLRMENGISRVEDEYIEQNGVYLDISGGENQ